MLDTTRQIRRRVSFCRKAVLSARLGPSDSWPSSVGILAWKRLTILSSAIHIHALKQESTKGNPTMSNPAETTIPVVDFIPLKALEFEAKVVGAMARVTCRQDFKNEGQKPVEAVYVFPLPDEAAVSACHLKIGDNRNVTAEIKTKEVARQEYDAAISSGHHAARVEQMRDNIFKMNVGGIEPGENVRVVITYNQPVPWQANGGRFRIPLVVAPRFIPGVPVEGKSGGGWSPDTDQVPDASEITPPVAREGVPYHVNVIVKLDPGFPCELASPSHPDVVKKPSLKKGSVKIETGEILTDRDFILTFQSASSAPEIAVHRADTENEQFAMISIIPPIQTKLEPAEIVFLLDISGSMKGPKLEGQKYIVKNLLKKLLDQQVAHRVGVVLFESSAHVLIPMGDLSEDMLAKIDTIRDLGGTELSRGMKLAQDQFTSGTTKPKFIVLTTDGQTESHFYQNQGERIIAIGIDTAVNDSDLKLLTAKSGGSNEWFYPGEDFDGAVNRLEGMLSGPVLQKLSVKTEGNVVGLRDVFKGRPAVICIRSAKLADTITLCGTDPHGRLQGYDIDLKDAPECKFLPQVWARDAIRETPDVKRQEELSLKYKVLCSATSFVAVSEKKVPGEAPVRVEIPVNLPHAWDYDAVFGQSGVKSVFAGYARRSVDPVGGGSPRGSALKVGPNYLGSPNLKSGFSDATFGGRNSDQGFHSYSFGLGHDKGHSTEELLAIPSDPPEEFTTVFDEDGEGGINKVNIENKLIAKLNYQPGAFNILAGAEEAVIACYVLFSTSKNAAHYVTLRQTLILSVVKAMTPRLRARSLYFAIKLQQVCNQQVLDDAVLKALAIKPVEPEALSWYKLAMKELGRPMTDQITLPQGAEGDYVAWKLGQRGRPTELPWSAVP